MPWTVVWETCEAADWNNPDARWTRLEKEFTDELTAVRHWGALARYANTLPISITPEPDWSRYTYGK